MRTPSFSLVARAARPALVAACLAAGCVPSAESRVATFVARPGSTEAGHLRGPFTGRVLDAANQSPVAGAIVYATWTFESGAGFALPAGHHEFTGSTDAEGRYTVPMLPAVPAGSRLTAFALVVYKRGFVGYRSDRRFPDGGVQHEFAQRDAELQLERWRGEFSHARHVRYLGGGGAIPQLTAWELEEAAAEQATAGRGGAPLRSTGQGYVVAAQLLRAEDIKLLSKYDGQFETGPLGDEPDTSVYSSQHFRALGRPEAFDVAVRMWRLAPGEAQEHYQDLIGTMPAPSETDEIASRSFRASEPGIHGVGFLDGPRGVVVLLTCGTSQCANIDQAVELTDLIHDRITAIVPSPSAAADGGQP